MVARQVAIRVVHQFLVVVADRQAHVAAADAVRLAFHIALQRGQGVGQLAVPAVRVRMLDEHVQGAVGARWQRIAPLCRRNIHATQALAVVKVHHQAVVAARVDDGALEAAPVARIDAVARGPGLQRTRVAAVVVGVVQLAVQDAGAHHQLLAQGAFEAQREFILRQRFQANGRHFARIAALAVRVVGRIRLADRMQARRRARDGIDARVGEHLAGGQEGAGHVARQIRRHRQMVAATVGEEFQGAVTQVVPGGAHARGDHVALRNEGHAIGTVVGELFAAQAQVQQHPLRDLIVILDVLRRLHAGRTRQIGIQVLADIIAILAVAAALGRRLKGAVDRQIRIFGFQIAPAVAAGQAQAHLRFHVDAVDAAAQRVLAQLVFEVQALGFLAVFRGRVNQGARHRLRIGIGEARHLGRRVRRGLRQQRVVAIRRAGVRSARLAHHGRHRQLIRQIARVLEDVDIRAWRSRRAAAVDGGFAPAARHVVAFQRGIVEAIALAVRCRAVIQLGIFKVMIIRQIVVQLGHHAVNLALALAPAVRQHFVHQVVARTSDRAAIRARLFQRHEGEQFVLDQRPAAVQADDLAGAAVIAVPVLQGAIRLRIGARVRVIAVFRRALQRAGDDGHLAAEFDLVAAALGGDVDHAARGTAKFRAVAARQHLQVGNRAKRQLRRAHLCQEVGDGEAIDVERVFRLARAADRRRIAIHAVGAARHARRQLHDGSHVIPDRQRFQFLGGEDHAIVRVRHVDRVARRFHHDGLLLAHRAGRAGRTEVRFRTGADQRFDFLRRFDRTGPQHAHRIAAWRHGVGHIAARRIGRQAALHARRQVFQYHGGAGRRAHFAENGAGGVRLCPGLAWHAGRQCDHDRGGTADVAQFESGAMHDCLSVYIEGYTRPPRSRAESGERNFYGGRRPVQPGSCTFREISPYRLIFVFLGLL